MSGMAKIFRPFNGNIEVRLRWAPGNRDWLHRVVGNRARVVWDGEKWLLSRRHYDDVLAALRRRYGRVRVTEEYSSTRRCTSSCQTALPETVLWCTCPCAGGNHGGGEARQTWRLVGERLLVSSERFTLTYIVTD